MSQQLINELTQSYLKTDLPDVPKSTTPSSAELVN